MKIKDVVAKRLENYQTIPRMKPGVLGNIATHVVEVPNRTSMVYVTLTTGVVLDNVLNTRVPNQFGLPVNIGFDFHDLPRTLRVLGARDINSLGIDNPANGMGYHRIQHEWPHGDTVHVWGEQFLPGLFVPIAGTLTVNIYPGTYKTSSGFKKFTQVTVVDLAASVAAVTATHASYSVIVVDSSGTFQVRNGALVDEQASPFLSAYTMLADSDMPALTAGDIPICAVKLYYGQTEFYCDGNRNDFVDLRFANGGGGMMDASELPYTPAVTADWDGSTDPGETNDALDQLAERVTDVEGAGSGGSDVAPNAPPFYLPVATNGLDGFATQWTMQSSVLYANNKTFVFYLADDYDEWCTIYDHEAQTWSDPVEIADGHASDNHNYLSAAIDSDGYIHIVYGCHDSTLYFKKSSAPYDISAWSVEASLATYATYPKIVIDSTDNIFVFYRSDNSNANYARYIKFLKSTDGGANWSAAVTLVDSGVNLTWAYQSIVGLGSDDSLHFAWTWRDSDGGAQEEFYDVCYMKSPDGGTTWEKSDGSDYSLPATQVTAEVIATGQYMIVPQVALDEDNNPQVVYVVSNSDSYFVLNHIHYCYLSGGVWQDVTLAGEDYALSTHIQVDGSVFYIFGSQLISGKYEIVMFQSLDSGANWTKYQLTSGSANDNINLNIKQNTNGGLEMIWTQTTAVWYMSEDWIEQLRISQASAPVVDAADVTYTPAVTADWDGSTDPGDTGDALDQLADRVKDIETAPLAGKYRQFLYTVIAGDPTFLTDDDGNILTVPLDLE